MVDKQKDAQGRGRPSRGAFFTRYVAVVLMGTVMLGACGRAVGEQMLPDWMFVEGKLPEGKLKDYLENLKREAEAALSGAKKATVNSDVAMAEAQKTQIEWENAISQVKKALAEGKLVLADRQDRAKIIEMLELQFKKK
ncbi:MAG: hypothetical protein L3J67_03525 [Hyphomicrobiaceae bacterium]|nr:hypothetical protein [Hyphomicrobiaceae bacterium]